MRNRKKIAAKTEAFARDPGTELYVAVFAASGKGR